MFDFLDNFFDTTVKTVRNGLILMVIALAVYFGVKQKSIVAFGTTALAGSIALWIASPSGLGIFPRLFGEAIESSACLTDGNGAPLGRLWYSGSSKGGAAVPRPGTKTTDYPYWRCDPATSTTATEEDTQTTPTPVPGDTESSGEAAVPAGEAQSGTGNTEGTTTTTSTTAAPSASGSGPTTTSTTAAPVASGSAQI